METITFKDFKARQGFWADREEEVILLEKQGIKDNDIIVNFAYTDYGGDFFDRIAIQFFDENKEENFLSHKTVYYGKNGILWGNTAVKFWEDTQKYLLGYEDIEDFYFNEQGKIQVEEATRFLNEVKYNEENLSEETKDLCFDYFKEYLEDKSILSSGYIDFCYSEAEEKLAYIIENVLPLELSKIREEKTNKQYFNIIK